ncbi:DUF1858 domain-containing protein [Carboxylicivirga taeanensis]|uniref:DUF1858 domain-containing protein n=1 Tax=Carboxylicivirga taeanensis TaxID=1416875 RepID=UPI003F6DF1F0
MDPLIITPRTKIFDLLEAYPQLEDSLIALAPPFKKLKNPILRKTITKVTSLSQAAVIGGLKVEELINKLRTEVGQDTTTIQDAETSHYNWQKPDWFSEDHVHQQIDISDMLNSGEQPVHEVIAAIKKLPDGQLIKVNTPFIPAPLLDKTISLKVAHWIQKTDESNYHIFFLSAQK